MLDKRTLDQASLHTAFQLLQPSRPILITTMNPNGTVNAAPAAWVTPASENPPMFTVALLTLPAKQHTLQNIERTGEFVLNAPTLSIARKMVTCSYDYDAEVSKFDLVGFEAQPSLTVTPPGIKECRANLECKVKDIIPVGDHTLVIADLLAAHYDKGCYAEDLTPILHSDFPCLHVKRFHQDEGQVHAFLSPTGTVLTYAPYNPEER